MLRQCPFLILKELVFLCQSGEESIYIRLYSLLEVLEPMLTCMLSPGAVGREMGIEICCLPFWQRKDRNTIQQHFKPDKTNILSPCIFFRDQNFTFTPDCSWYAVSGQKKKKNMVKTQWASISRVKCSHRWLSWILVNRTLSALQNGKNTG